MIRDKQAILKNSVTPVLIDSMIVVLGNVPSPVQAYTRDGPLTVITYHDESEMLLIKVDTTPLLNINT